MRTLDIYTRGWIKSDTRIVSTAVQEARCGVRVERAGAELGQVFDPARVRGIQRWLVRAGMP